MREMKDSGIAWLKSIPCNWNVERGKNILNLQKRPVRDTDEVITCFRDGEVVLRSERRTDGFTMSDKEIGYQGINEGDIVIHGMDGFAGAMGISKSTGKGSPVLIVCTPKYDAIPEYLIYYLRTLAMTDVFIALATGIRERSCDLRWNKISDLEFVLPSSDEQRLIANFLDKKCGEIDELVALQEKMIDELKAYKQSVITETVTKGLDPNVKMKDSGVEWIGEIPEYWSSQRFKDTAQVKANLVHPNDYLDYPQVAPDCIGKGNGLLLHYKSVRESNVISDNHLFYKGQIVYSKIRPTLNKLIVAEFDGLCSADMYPIETSNDIQYQKYFMLSDVFLAQVALVVQDRVKMPKINQEEIGVIKVITPPLSEQHSIATYLDEKCSDIDSLISIKQKKIDELKDYKKSLIYEYVTGKKQVG